MMNDDDDGDDDDEANVMDDDGKNLINPVETLLIPPPTNTFSQSLFLANVLLRKIAVFLLHHKLYANWECSPIIFFSDFNFNFRCWPRIPLQYQLMPSSITGCRIMTLNVGTKMFAIIP